MLRTAVVVVGAHHHWKSGPICVAAFQWCKGVTNKPKTSCSCGRTMFTKDIGTNPYPYKKCHEIFRACFYSHKREASPWCPHQEDGTLAFKANSMLVRRMKGWAELNGIWTYSSRHFKPDTQSPETTPLAAGIWKKPTAMFLYGECLNWIDDDAILKLIKGINLDTQQPANPASKCMLLSLSLDMYNPSSIHLDLFSTYI